MTRFLRDQRGVVAVLFGLLLIPALGVAGAALDYSRAINAKTQLQAALDATALALAREPSDMSEEELLEFADTYFAANHARSFNFEYELTSVRRSGDGVILTGSAVVPTTVFAVLGVDDVPVDGYSEVAWGTDKVEIALVLDNTGSMRRQNRMARLKEASRVLLDVLERQVRDPEDVRISIVPFDMHVRVETSHAGASWLEPLGGGPGNSGDAGGNANNTPEWAGCIEDRNKPYDVDATPADSQQTRYPAVECNSDSLETILRLTGDFDELRRKISRMSPAGWTNITIGLAWGLNMLHPAEPFTDAEPYDTDDLTKIMILMTDGENTRNRWNDASAQIDVRTRMACNSVKDKGIMLYTVRFMEGDQALLRNCATRPDMFYDIQQLDQLRPAFETIAAQITQLRLTR